MSHDLTVDDMDITHCWNSEGTWGDRSCEELKRVQRCRDCKVFRQAGRQLLERPVPEDYAQHWSKQIARADEGQTDKGHAVLIFRIGDEYFAFAANKIGEVMPGLPTHQIPHAKGSALQGVVSIRGEIKLLVSLRQVLEIADEHENHGDAWIIRAWSGSDELVFSVTALCGIYRYQPAELTAVPATLSASISELTAGMIDWQEQHVALLAEPALYKRIVRGLR